MSYDSHGVRLVSTKNALGHEESYTYDRYGNMLSFTGANGLVTKYAYDVFDRKILETRPDGTSTRMEVRFSGPTSSLKGGVYSERITRTGEQDTVKIYDSLDRPIRVESKGFGGNYIYEDIVYDRFGHVQKQSLPFFPKDQKPSWVTFVYDKTGREISERRPFELSGSAQSQKVYNGLITQTIDANGNRKTVEKDALGRIVQVTDALGGTVRYEYDAVGNLIKTTDPAGHVTTLKYDQFGSKISIDDPDMGLWKYSYDAFGQKLWQKDAVGNQVFYTYDTLGRLVLEQNGEGQTKWVYDQTSYGKGKLVKTQSS